MNKKGLGAKLDGHGVLDGIRIRGYFTYRTVKIGTFGALIIDVTKQWKLGDLFFLGPNPVGGYNIYCIYWYGTKDDDIKQKHDYYYYKWIESEEKTFYVK